MALMRSIDIPIFFKIEEGILFNLVKILSDFNLNFKKSLIVYGEKPIDKTAKIVSNSFESFSLQEIANNTIEDVEKIEEVIDRKKPDIIIGVGGGKTIDPAKLAATRMQTGFISIPTILSHDGIASPVAVIDYGDEVKSIGVRMPLGIVVDLQVIMNAPKRGIGAGIGDLLSNISAAEDWLLAEKHGREKVDPFAMMLARMPALNFLKSDYSNCIDKEMLRNLAKGLILSGIAMGIAGSSRPASGAEHLISHALDRIADKPQLHGEQVGIATIFSLYLHKKDEWKIIKDLYRNLNLSLKPEDLGLNKRIFLEAVKTAPSTRKGRFTILDIKGKDKDLLSEVYDEVYTV